MANTNLRDRLLAAWVLCLLVPKAISCSGKTCRLEASIAAIFLLCAITAPAQDFVSQGGGRPSLAGVEAATLRSNRNLDLPYNFRLGSARFSLSTTFLAEYNDNTNISDRNPQSDIILEPLLNIHGIWPVTAINDLNFNLGLGYRSYITHIKQYGSNTPEVTPDSYISFDVYINDAVKINFHDLIHISYDPTEQPALSNVRTFGRLENTVGATTTWDLNELIVQSTYDHFTYVSLTGEFDYLNRNAEINRTSVSYKATDRSTVGVETSAMYSYYSQNYQNDSTMVSGGVFSETTISHFLKLRTAAGFQGGYFDRGGGNGDDSNANGWYANALLANRLNSYCTQTLAGGHEIQLGLNSNYETMNFVRYDINLSVIRDVPVSFYGFYQHVNDSPSIQQESLDRYGGGIHFGYQWNRATTLGLDYQFIEKNSDLADMDYKQNRVFVTVNYSF
ncbi:MAG: hypothetical protein ACFUZC_12580 [Chthoniobacteraceae bacterium]